MSQASQRFGRHVRRAGFTLVELLVVIGIIALLISILMPALSKAREQSVRTACASNVRQFCQALIMCAQDHKGRFPDLTNSDGQYDATGNTTRYPYEVQVIHPYVRDQLLPKYGMTRKIYYCPGNKEMDTDDRWVKPDKANFAFVGYMILAGQTKLGVTKKQFMASGGKGGFEEVPDDDNRNLFALKHGQKAVYQVLVADTTRTWQNRLDPSNHVRGETSTGVMPKGKGGANVGYIDGHVDWRAQDELGQGNGPNGAGTNKGKRQYWFNDLRFWW